MILNFYNFNNQTEIDFLQVCDVKEDQYYCLDCAVKYLQSKKAAQRKHCKLLYTHSKEEISAIIKDVNKRLEDESSEDEESSDSDFEIKTRRISELSKEKKKELKNEIPKLSSPRFEPQTQSSGSGSRPKPTNPNVAPGTSISVSSFSLVSFYWILTICRQFQARICLLFII